MKKLNSLKELKNVKFSDNLNKIVKIKNKIQYNKNTFWDWTQGEFEFLEGATDFERLIAKYKEQYPNLIKNYNPEKTSFYLRGENFAIRISCHWGECGNCNWQIKPSHSKYIAGKIQYSDLSPIEFESIKLEAKRKPDTKYYNISIKLDDHSFTTKVTIPHAQNICPGINVSTGQFYTKEISKKQAIKLINQFDLMPKFQPEESINIEVPEEVQEADEILRAIYSYNDGGMLCFPKERLEEYEFFAENVKVKYGLESAYIEDEYCEKFRNSNEYLELIEKRNTYIFALKTRFTNLGIL